MQKPIIAGENGAPTYPSPNAVAGNFFVIFYGSGVDRLSIGLHPLFDKYEEDVTQDLVSEQY